jgi:type II secretory ATPase GspE/PulE/Tfp pilus assembly ATPase PilB-like protein/DNA-binding response OmpR family regulator
MAKYTQLFGCSDEEDQPFNQPLIHKYRILLVDDDTNMLEGLVRVFRKESYEIITATSGSQALAILAKTEMHLIVSDYMMPKMTGAKLLQKVKELHPSTIRILLTGHAETDAVMAAIKDGAVYKFVLKPWHADDFRITVSLALEQYELQKKNRQLEQKNIANQRELAMLSKLAVTNRSQLAILLQKRGLLNEKQLQEIYRLQQFDNTPVLTTILNKNWVNENAIRKLLKEQMMINEINLAEAEIDPDVIHLIPGNICKTNRVLPIQKQGNKLLLAMADPLDEGLIEELRFRLGFDINVVMASTGEFEIKFQEQFEDGGISYQELESITDMDDPLQGIEIVIDDVDDISIDELLCSSDEPPAIRLLNAIILEAIRFRASDIHIQPQAKHVVVRYRIDGVLFDKIKVPSALLMPLVSRVKIMSELDITERRRPQDGRITVRTPLRTIDLRISILPTLNGEKVVMRILDRSNQIVDLSELGFSQPGLKLVRHAVQRPQGIVLAAGPTGSGKTTTLYSFISTYATPEKNYVTIEDPVEYYMDSASQVAVKEQIGLRFDTVLRSILRQDPDVILLGEIRDIETAEVAFHAALTGHLVLSTVHTNSALSTVARLIELGLKPNVVSSALAGIISQRLVRKICEHCKEPDNADEEFLHLLGPPFADIPPQCYVGKGCNHCNGSGYNGRVGLYEIFVPSDLIRGLISKNANEIELMRATRKEGMRLLIEDAYDKVNQSQTTLAELLRVLGPQVIIT